MNTSIRTIWKAHEPQQLAEVMARITSVEAMQDFLRDVMTEKEVIEISARLEAAKMLQQGKKYTDISKKTKLSSRTIARISSWMQNGCGGYQNALAIIHHIHTPPARAE